MPSVDSYPCFDDRLCCACLKNLNFEMKQATLSRRVVYSFHVLFWVCYGAILFASLSNWISSPQAIWGAVISDVLTSSAIAYINFLWLIPNIYGKGKYTLYIAASVSMIISIVFLKQNSCFFLPFRIRY